MEPLKEQNSNHTSLWGQAFCTQWVAELPNHEELWYNLTMYFFPSGLQLTYPSIPLLPTGFAWPGITRLPCQWSTPTGVWSVSLRGTCTTAPTARTLTVFTTSPWRGSSRRPPKAMPLELCMSTMINWYSREEAEFLTELCISEMQIALLQEGLRQKCRRFSCLLLESCAWLILIALAQVFFSWIQNFRNCVSVREHLTSFCRIEKASNCNKYTGMQNVHFKHPIQTGLLLWKDANHIKNTAQKKP